MCSAITPLLSTSEALKHVYEGECIAQKLAHMKSCVCTRLCSGMALYQCYSAVWMGARGMYQVTGIHSPPRPFP